MTVSGRGFYDRPEIRDLLNVLRAVADPSDDVALAGLLRSPSCAWSDVDLYHLCQQRERLDGKATLWDVLRRVETGGDGERSQSAVRLIEGLNSMVGRTR